MQSSNQQPEDGAILPAVAKPSGERHLIRVLVVDDSVDHRMLMERRLVDAGLQVQTASTGEEALEKLDGVDLVLLDYRLPKMSGIETLAEIRERESAPSVIFVTGMGSTDVAVDAMRAGAIDYLAKNPGYLNQLPEVVERAWRQHDLVRRAGELQRLALLVNSASDRDQVFREIVSGARKLLEADTCALYVKSDDALEAVALIGNPSVAMHESVTGPTALRPEEGHPVIAPDRLLVALPSEGEEWIGFLGMFFGGAQEFAPEERHLAQAFASFAGIALRHLQRHELETSLIGELQRTLDARRDFVASVSHELRTPLTSIGGYTETVLSRLGELTEDRVRLFLEKVQDHSRELGDLVDRLIDVASAERGGGFRAELVPLDLQAEVRRGVESLEVLLGKRPIEVSVESVPVVADRHLFRRVLTNLISNAVKYSDEGSPITVTGEAVDETTAKISVTDVGIGLDSHQAAHVFDPFWRASSSVQNATRGAGIGLALVKEYVRSMHAQIAVSSQLGEGSTFTVTLQIATPEAVAPSDLGDKASSASPAEPVSSVVDAEVAEA